MLERSRGADDSADHAVRKEPQLLFQQAQVAWEVDVIVLQLLFEQNSHMFDTMDTALCGLLLVAQARQML
jgi:hypothetical protein